MQPVSLGDQPQTAPCMLHVKRTLCCMPQQHPFTCCTSEEHPFACCSSRGSARRPHRNLPRLRLHLDLNSSHNTCKVFHYWMHPHADIGPKHVLLSGEPMNKLLPIRDKNSDLQHATKIAGIARAQTEHENPLPKRATREQRHLTTSKNAEIAMCYDIACT